MEGFKNINENSNKESFKNDDDFVFLSEEELLALNDDERADYYRNLEKKAETNQIEYHSRAPEINNENSEENQKIIDDKEFNSPENPSDDLYERFNKFKENKKRKTTNPNRSFNGPKNPLFNPYR